MNNIRFLLSSRKQQGKTMRRLLLHSFVFCLVLRRCRHLWSCNVNSSQGNQRRKQNYVPACINCVFMMLFRNCISARHLQQLRATIPCCCWVWKGGSSCCDSSVVYYRVQNVGYRFTRLQPPKSTKERSSAF